MGWLRQLFTRRRRYDELSESIHEHLDEKIADLTDRGMTQEEAEQTARREFGNVTRMRSAARSMAVADARKHLGRCAICLAAIRQESGLPASLC